MSDDQQLALEIPDKVFFRIGEVAGLTGLKAYVLRYWETEFVGLKPQKSASGQRRYRRSDVEFVLQLKSLLWEQGFTIKGARTHLKSRKADAPLDATQNRQPSPLRAQVSPPMLGSVDDADLQRRLTIQSKDLNTVRRALTHMRSELAAFLDDLDK